MEWSELRDYYRQWRSDLYCCLPSRLRRLLDPGAAPVVLELRDGNKLRAFQHLDGERTELGTLSLERPNPTIEPLKSLKRGGRPLILLLPAGWVLNKRARFPAAAMENLRQVVGFEMDRLTPFPATQVSYDCRIAERAGESGELVVDLAILPRARLDPVLRRVKEVGVPITAVATPDSWEGVNLLPQEARSSGSKAAVVGAILLWALLASLLVVALGTPLWHKRKVAIELEQRAARTKKEAMAVTALRGEVDQGLKLLNQVPERRNRIPPAVDVIKDLTILLPDGTWVQQFELKGGKLELRGLSQQATSLIQRLEGAPGFHNVGFRSPVLQAQGQERFHLSADLITAQDLMASGE